MALLRYVLVAVVRSLRLVAPMTVYVALVLIFNTDPGTVLGTYGTTAAFLLPISIWITYAAVNSEDGPQAAITATAVNSVTTVRFVKVLVAGLLGLPLTAFAVLVPPVLRNYRGSLHATDIIAGIVGHLLTIVAGCGIGSILMRPIIERTGTAFLVATTSTLCQLLLPHCPPTRQLLDAFEADQPHHLLQSLTVTTGETLALSMAVLVAVLAWARRTG